MATQCFHAAEVERSNPESSEKVAEKKNGGAGHEEFSTELVRWLGKLPQTILHRHTVQAHPHVHSQIGGLVQVAARGFRAAEVERSNPGNATHYFFHFSFHSSAGRLDSAK